LAGVFGGLPLRVVEIGGDRDDSLLDLLPEIGFRRLLHLLENEGGDLRWWKGLAVDFHPGIAIRGPGDLVGDKLFVLFNHRVVVPPADQARDCKNGLFRICDRLAFSRLADKTFTVICKGNNRRRRSHAFGVFDDFGGLAFHDGNARVGGAEVDANDLTHGFSSQIAAARPGPLAPEMECRGSSADPRSSPLDTRFAAFSRLTGSYRRVPPGRKSVSYEIASRRRRLNQWLVGHCRRRRSRVGRPSIRHFGKSRDI